jgi:hypothetical protein
VSSDAGAAALWSAVAVLAEADLDSMPDAARLVELRELWPALCAAQAQIARRIGAVHVNGAAVADGFVSTPAWLRTRLRLDRGPAARLVKAGARLDDLPDTDAGADLGAEAMAAGVERVLLDHAGTVAPAAVRELARHIKQRLLDDEEATARQERLRADRWLDAVTTFEGAVAIKGVLDPVAGQSVLAAYTTGPDPLGAPGEDGIGRSAT